MAFTPKFYVASTEAVLSKAISLGLFTYPGICYIKDKHNLAWMLDTNVPSLIIGKNQITDLTYDKDSQTLTAYSGEEVIFDEKIECNDEQITGVVNEILNETLQDYYTKSETDSTLINLNDELKGLIQELQETLSGTIKEVQEDVDVIKEDVSGIHEDINVINDSIDTVKENIETLKEEIPTKVSELDNDSEFLTKPQVEEVVVESVNTSEEIKNIIKDVANDVMEEEAGSIDEATIRSWF